MKTLKVKFVLFSLLAVLAVALTSCEQEDILTPEIESEITAPSLDDDISDRGDYSFD